MTLPLAFTHVTSPAVTKQRKKPRWIESKKVRKGEAAMWEGEVVRWRREEIAT